MRPEDPFYPHRVESYLDELATEELRRMQVEQGAQEFLAAFDTDTRVAHGINLTYEDSLRRGLRNGNVRFDNLDGSSSDWTPNTIQGEPHTVTYGAPYDSYARNDGLHVVTTVAEMHSTLKNEPIFVFLQTIRRQPHLETPLTIHEFRSSYPALLGRRRAGSLALYADNFDGSTSHWVEIDPATAETIVTTELSRYTKAAQARKPQATTDTPPAN